jgi:hypothetical protein
VKDILRTNSAVSGRVADDWIEPIPLGLPQEAQSVWALHKAHWMLAKTVLVGLLENYCFHND